MVCRNFNIKDVSLAKVKAFFKETGTSLKVRKNNLPLFFSSLGVADKNKITIANLMGFVTSELTKPHDEITWGHVGNLQHVRRNLIETVAFLSGIEE